MENCLFTESLCLSNCAEWVSDIMLCGTKKKEKETRKKTLLLACMHLLTLTLSMFTEEGEPLLAQSDAILFTVLRREGCLESGNLPVFEKRLFREGLSMCIQRLSDLSRGTLGAVWGWLTNRLFVRFGAGPSGLLRLREGSEVSLLLCC